MKKKLKARHRLTYHLFKEAGLLEDDAFIRWEMSKITNWNTLAHMGKARFDAVAKKETRPFDVAKRCLIAKNRRQRSIEDRYKTCVYHKPGRAIAYGDAVGFEIECIVPVAGIEKLTKVKKGQYEGADSYAERELKNLVEDRKIKFVNITDDGSINYNHNIEASFEFRVLSSIKDDFANLKALCELLVELETKVNKSCGLHVHLDQRHRSVEDVAKVANRLQNSLFGLKFIVPENRRKNSYCIFLKNVDQKLYEFYKATKIDYEAEGDIATEQRYSAVNTQAYSQHKTIEIRLHSGSTSFEKIHNWVKILLNISENDAFDTKFFSGPELQKLESNKNIMKIFTKLLFKNKKDAALEDYIWDRFDKFDKSQPKTAEESADGTYISRSGLRSFFEQPINSDGLLRLDGMELNAIDAGSEPVRIPNFNIPIMSPGVEAVNWVVTNVNQETGTITIGNSPRVVDEVLRNV